MGDVSQNTMAKVGATLSWRDLENEERKADGPAAAPGIHHRT